MHKRTRCMAVALSACSPYLPGLKPAELCESCLGVEAVDSPHDGDCIACGRLILGRLVDDSSSPPPVPQFV